MTLGADDEPSPACCHAAAADASAGFCGDCGRRLLRCMAWSECGGLLGDDGRCTLCMRPQLFLDQGAVREVKVGGRMVLPLLFRNDARAGARGAAAGRPIFITGLWVKEADGPRIAKELAWERLDGGQALPWSLQTSALDKHGRMRVEISFAAATRYRWRQETFIFVAELDLVAEEGGGLVINQTINAEGGATAYAPIRLETQARERAAPEVRKPLALVRGERLERADGVRGYADKGLIQRSARLTWKGFAPGEAPADGPIATPDGLIGMGRTLTRAEGGEGDVRLLVRDRDGALDDGLSAAISRRHADLFIQDGRLYVHAAGAAGLLVGKRAVERGTIAQVEDGDLIEILPRAKGAITLAVSMKAHHRLIEDITIERAPAHVEDRR
jgi:hypothetical protein